MLSLALLEPAAAGLRCVAELALPDGGKHGTALPASIEQLLQGAGLTQAALSGFALGLGPGSFTGLRVGIATVKTLAYARRLPLGGVSSLRALALEVLRDRPERIVAAILDARHGEIYMGLFTGAAAEPLIPEVSLAPAALAAALGSGLGFGLDSTRDAAVLIGEGVAAYRAAFEKDFDSAALAAAAAGPQTPRALAVAELCWPLPPFSLERVFGFWSRVTCERPKAENRGSPRACFVRALGAAE